MSSNTTKASAELKAALERVRAALNRPVSQTGRGADSDSSSSSSMEGGARRKKAVDPEKARRLAYRKSTSPTKSGGVRRSKLDSPSRRTKMNPAKSGSMMGHAYNYAVNARSPKGTGKFGDRVSKFRTYRVHVDEGAFPTVQVGKNRSNLFLQTAARGSTRAVKLRGTPMQAAKKAVTAFRKHGLAPESEVSFTLVEITKGVSKKTAPTETDVVISPGRRGAGKNMVSHHEKYKYSYIGKYVPLDEPTVREVRGKEITNKFKTVVVARRNSGSMQQALGKRPARQHAEWMAERKAGKAAVRYLSSPQRARQVERLTGRYNALKTSPKLSPAERREFVSLRTRLDKPKSQKPNAKPNKRGARPRSS
jgi:hypothetical protein